MKLKSHHGKGDKSPTRAKTGDKFNGTTRVTCFKITRFCGEKWEMLVHTKTPGVGVCPKCKQLKSRVCVDRQASEIEITQSILTWSVSNG